MAATWTTRSTAEEICCLTIRIGKSMPVIAIMLSNLAMQSRGYRGEVRIVNEFRARGLDWLWLSGFAAVAVAVLWISVGGLA